MDQKPGTTVSNNAPVGTAGNPAVTDASSKGRGMQRGKGMTKEKSAAIERRMKNLAKRRG